MPGRCTLPAFGSNAPHIGWKRRATRRASRMRPSSRCSCACPDHREISMQRNETTLRGLIAMLGLVLAGAMYVRVPPAKVGQAQSTPPQREDSAAPLKPLAALSPYIDVHTHLDETNVGGSMQSAIEAMPQENLAKIVFMPSPF